MVQPFFDKIPKIKRQAFEKSSYVPMWEERGKYMEVVGHFFESKG